MNHIILKITIKPREILKEERLIIPCSQQNIKQVPNLC